jgi:hypothetical protein
MGLTDIHEYPNIQLTGDFRGKPVTIYAWQITGRLGNLTVDMIQPAEGQANAYTNFLSKHGDGILSVVYEVATRQAMEEEIRRMQKNGVAVLQQVTVLRDRVPLTYTYFDTEPQGKFALGLVYAPGGMPAASGPARHHAFWRRGVGCRASVGILGAAGFLSIPDAESNSARRRPVSRQSAVACIRGRLSARRPVQV